MIVGNVIRRVNPEATAVRERGMPQMSFPAAFGALFLRGRHSVVVAGTHGKTTTSALMAHVLVTAGARSVVPRGRRDAATAEATSASGTGPHFVVEGDEYDTAYFDKGPKFLHYRRARRSSPAWSSTTRTSTATWRTTSRRSSKLRCHWSLPDGRIAVSARLPERGGAVARGDGRRW